MIDTRTGFTSILWPDRHGHAVGPEDPQTLHDLALDRVIAALPSATGRAAWATPLLDPDDVMDRQDVFAALGREPIRDALRQLLADWSEIRDALHGAEHSRFDTQRDLWRLRTATRYLAALDRLAQALPAALADWDGTSRLLDDLAEHVTRLIHAPATIRAAEQGRALTDQIDGIRADVLIQGGKVTVADYDDEPDLATAVLATFDRFRQGTAHSYLVEYTDNTDLDHVQGQILDLIVDHHPDLFVDLSAYTAEVAELRDPALDTLVDELPFYLDYLDLIRPLRDASLSVCRPALTHGGDRLTATRTWDLALAVALVGDGRPVVVNDLGLAGPERILVISGPNQGGKTTTARTFGQLHYLASLGCPVPGAVVELHLPDRVATLFEQEEQLDSLEGRLGTEIDRIHDLLDHATDRTVIVLNEAFSSTTLDDARTLTREILHRIEHLDASAVCVTFIDELSRLDDTTVSMTSTVDPDEPSRRTFRVERRRADGRAYVEALAGRHHLTRAEISRRITTGAPA